MTERDTDTEAVEAQYRGGCAADGATSMERIPSEIPETAYVLTADGREDFPERPIDAVPSNEPLRDVSTTEIIDYLASVIPEYANRLAAEPVFGELRQVTGESADMLTDDIEFIRQLAAPEYLRGLLDIGGTDLGEYLDDWHDADGYAERALPLGRGININAGHNVATAVIPELWRALTRNAVLHKAPSSDQTTLRVLHETYADNPHPVADTFAVAYWPGGAEELERSLYTTDYVMAWGDDQTIDAIRGRIGSTTRFLPYHFEFGVYLVDAATQRERDEPLLRAIARDFSWGDQLLCFSPLVMVVEDCEATEEFLADLAATLEAYTEEYAMGAVPDAEQMQLTRAKRMHRAAGTLVSSFDNDTTVVLEDGLERGHLEEFDTFRFVEAHRVSELETAVETLAHNRHLQEFVLATTPERGDALRDRLFRTQATRIVSPGGAAPRKPVPWDGTHQLDALVRWVTDERTTGRSGEHFEGGVSR